MERRATRRFPLKLPMRVRWATKSGNGEADTESEDISSRGVYFFLPRKIEKGSWVELLLFLPHEITLAEPVQARCHARVRRTEIKVDGIGVAAEIEFYQFAQGSVKVVDGKVITRVGRPLLQLNVLHGIKMGHGVKVPNDT